MMEIDSENELNPETVQKLELTPSVSEFFKLYDYKLKAFSSDNIFKLQAEKYWALLDKNYNGEIEKKEYVKLFSKMYKLILPLHNYEEIPYFIENEWNIYSMNKTTMNLHLFQKYLFRITHFLCVHVNKQEYDGFLNLIYKRLIKFQKILPSNITK